MRGAPIRFLLLVLGLWIGARAAILLPDWRDRVAPIPPAAAAPRPGAVAAAPVPAAPVGTGGGDAQVAAPALRPVRDIVQTPGTLPGVVQVALRNSVMPPAGRSMPVPSRPVLSAASVPPPLSAPRLSPNFRWSLSGWLLVRREEGQAALAPGGTLGGSQAGARLSYALGGGVALSARAYLPLRPAAGAELGAGVDWRPIGALPLHLLAERRQRLGREGRSAFALTFYGGTSHALTPRLRLDLYGQAGIVGVNARNLFADGSLRLARRVGPVELGGGAWGAAQPGTARVDAGPSLSWRLPVPRTHIRLQADWRFRLAGEAAPRSGPALTLATDF